MSHVFNTFESGTLVPIQMVERLRNEVTAKKLFLRILETRFEFRTDSKAIIIIIRVTRTVQ